MYNNEKIIKRKSTILRRGIKLRWWIEKTIWTIWTIWTINPVYKNIKIMSILLVIGYVKIGDKDERGMERMSGGNARNS